MYKKIKIHSVFYLLLVMLSLGSNLKGQSIVIAAHEQSLSAVLVELREQHGIKLSFDDQLLSKYQVNLDQTFQSIDAALDVLIQNLPLSLEIVDGVYVFSPQSPAQKSDRQFCRGRVIEEGSGESLPFSHMTINGQGLLTDGQGNFSFESRVGDEFLIKVSHLGYHLKDTIVPSGEDHQISLNPAILGIQEVIINQAVTLSTMSKLASGEIRLNQLVGRYLPGFADNGVYNLLRLQPGLLASGEQAHDLVIWGSYPGQSAVLFDGFTLFGLKNFNDNIGFVNPYMVKDATLLKGAYPANYGGKSGGIIDITGKSGDRNKPRFELSATSLVLNGLLSVPINKKAALSLAIRQTYYNLYRFADLEYSSKNRGMQMNKADLTVKPNYGFRDLNLKYAGGLNNGDQYYVSFLAAADAFSYTAEWEKQNRIIYSEREQINRQKGAALNYNKKWANGNASEMQISYSDLSNSDTRILNAGAKMNSHGTMNGDVFRNGIKKTKIDNRNTIYVNGLNLLEIGVGAGYYDLFFQSDSVGKAAIDERSDLIGFEAFVQDRITINDRLNLLLGVRLDLPMHEIQPLIQPRVSASYQLFDHLWMQAAWGMHHQYIVQSSTIDEAGNYQFFWTSSKKGTIPLQKGQHFTAGIKWSGKYFSMGVEGYRKNLTGLTRYVYQPGRKIKELFTGHGNSMGLDFLFETQLRRHSFWLAYTLSQSLEYFEYFPNKAYRRAPHDQRHEIKLAGLLDFHPIYISGNYVFGSGFPSWNPSQYLSGLNNYNYSRLDLSMVYRFNPKKFDMEAGLSILNVLNRKNLKMDNLVRLPEYQGSTLSIHAEAVPFTPTIFLKIGL